MLKKTKLTANVYSFDARVTAKQNYMMVKKLILDEQVAGYKFSVYFRLSPPAPPN